MTTPQDAAGAAEVLRRIAYLLERAREPTYRVRAFRNAASALDEAGAERIQRLWETNRLTELAGIGPTTAAVTGEVLAGQVPAYLERLESSAEPESTEDLNVRALVGQLRGDLHVHSDWSDGGSPVKEMVEAATRLGHEYLAITDHSPRLKVANGLDAARLGEQLELIAELNADHTRAVASQPNAVALTGIEVDILEDGNLDQDAGLLATLDIVVASVHSKLRMNESDMTARMIAAVQNPHVDILGHCTGRIVVGKGRPPSTFDAAAVFAACAAGGTAVEINSRPERLDPPDDLLQVAVDAGCLFSIDTDAHAPGQLEWQHYGAAKAVAASVPFERIISAWPLAKLRDWTESRRMSD